jgi:hypothetical protein
MPKDTKVNSRSRITINLFQQSATDIKHTSNQLAWKKNVCVMLNNTALTLHVKYSKTIDFDHVLKVAMDQTESLLHGNL